jgi:phosphoserine phosphatase
MDSTLIQTEVIDELAELAGVVQVRAITEAAMNGEIDFSESFKQRMALLEGLSEEVLQTVAENLPITKGAHRLMKALKYYGYKTAILSEGLLFLENTCKRIGNRLCVHANELEIIDGKLTGNYLGEIVDGKRKPNIYKPLQTRKAFTSIKPSLWVMAPMIYRC